MRNDKNVPVYIIYIFYVIYGWITVKTAFIQKPPITR